MFSPCWSKKKGNCCLGCRVTVWQLWNEKDWDQVNSKHLPVINSQMMVIWYLSTGRRHLISCAGLEGGRCHNGKAVNEPLHRIIETGPARFPLNMLCKPLELTENSGRVYSQPYPTPLHRKLAPDKAENGFHMLHPITCSFHSIDCPFLRGRSGNKMYNWQYFLSTL